MTGQPEAPRQLRPGLAVLAVATTVTGPVVTTSADSAVLVNVGRPYRLAETLGDAARRTPGMPGDVAVVPAGVPLTVRSGDGTPQAVQSLVVTLSPAVVAEVLDAAGQRGGAELVPAVGARSPAVAQLAGLLHAGLPDRTDLGRLALESLGSALAVAVVRDHSTARTTAGRPAPGAGLPPRRLDQVLRRVEEGLATPLAVADLAACADVSEFHFSRLFRASTGVSPHQYVLQRRLAPRQLDRVLRLVDEDLATPLAVADLAVAAHVSEFHFSRLFRASTGVSPHQYVLQRRLARARELLLATDLPVAAVAARCGFADQSHLTRHVRRRFGQTPTALRAAARAR